MCHECHSTPVDPLDKLYVDGEITGVTFLDEGFGLTVTIPSGDETVVPCLPVTPAPRLGEHVRMYGGPDVGKLEGTMRGLIVGVGQGETPRKAMYRTLEQEHELEEALSRAVRDFLTLGKLLEMPDVLWEVLEQLAPGINGNARKAHAKLGTMLRPLAAPEGTQAPGHIEVPLAYRHSPPIAES